MNKPGAEVCRDRDIKVYTSMGHRKERRMDYKLLIADDEEIICKGLASLIDWSSVNAEVVGTAFDGEEALNMIRREHPDIVILDINLPFINGLEIAGIAEKEYPKTRVIMLTAYKEFEYARTAVKYHVFDYLTKPCRNDEVKETVRRAIQDIEKERDIKEERIKKTEKRKNGRITKIMDYISTHYSDPDLTLKRLADDLYISPSHIQNLLHEENTSFSEILNRVRMEKAMELLTENDEVKIYEVAYMAGFNSSQYFSRRFKEYYGTEPKNVRRGTGKLHE